MALQYTDAFRYNAVRIATTNELTQPQAACDLRVGLSTLTKWVEKHASPSRALHRNVPRESMTI